MNTVLRYPGAKTRIAPWVISFMPEHHTYVEPYFGSGAVLLNKSKSNIETVNDLDGEVTNLFEIIRRSPEELARAVALTPYSRGEYDSSFEKAGESEKVEQARRFLVRCWQGHGFRTNSYKVGWKNDVQGREKAYALSNWVRLPGWILECTERLKEVQIDNRPALEVIKRHKYRNVLIYADPPYVLSSRTAKQYKHEMTDQDHVELLEVLLDHPGPVMLSGYDNQIYTDMLQGWHRESIRSSAEYCGKRFERPEVLWMNFEPFQQIRMF